MRAIPCIDLVESVVVPVAEDLPTEEVIRAHHGKLHVIESKVGHVREATARCLGRNACRARNRWSTFASNSRWQRPSAKSANASGNAG